MQVEIDTAVKALTDSPRGSKLSYEQAVALVLKENPELYDKYLQAQAATVPVLTAKAAVDRLEKSANDAATAMLAARIMREEPSISFTNAMELASYQTRYGT